MRDDFDALAEMRSMLKMGEPEGKTLEQLQSELVKNNQEIQSLKLKGMLHCVEKEMDTVLKSITCSFQSHLISNPGETLKSYQLSFIETTELATVIEMAPNALIIHCPYDIHGVYNKEMPSCSSEEEMKGIIKKKIVANIAHDIAYIEEKNAELTAEISRQKKAA